MVNISMSVHIIFVSNVWRFLQARSKIVPGKRTGYRFFRPRKSNFVKICLVVFVSQQNMRKLNRNDHEIQNLSFINEYKAS